MRLILSAIIFVLISCSPSLAFGRFDEGKFSIMYSEKECRVIHQEREYLTHKEPAKLSKLNSLRLDGIAYIDDKRWSVWINNQIVDPAHPHADIEIVKVAAETISFRMKDQDKTALLTMQINQEINLENVHYADGGLKHGSSTVR